MSEAFLERAVGRNVFGSDAAGYAAGRLSYPAAIYNRIAAVCSLEDAQVFEIGPGSGQATAELIRRGAIVTAIEPDPALATTLANNVGASPGQLIVRNEAFETAKLAPNTFDLGVAATSFTWLDPDIALPNVLDALRPGGWWAMWWNLFEDVRGDPIFQAALRDTPRPPSFSSGRHAALDHERWLRKLAANGFTNAAFEKVEHTVEFTPAALRALYATFSPLRALPVEKRDQRLAAVEASAADEAQDGIVRRVFSSPFYLAQKPL